MTETEICNLALARIGDTRISSFEDDTKPARLCKDLYDPTRDEVLRSHRWNFATKRRTCSRLEEDPPFVYNHYYQLPEDCLRVMEVNGSESSFQDHNRWEVEGKRIASNAEECNLVYTHKETNSSNFDPVFVESLSLKLASKFATALRGSSSQVAEVLQEYITITKPLAGRVDASEARGRSRFQPDLQSRAVQARRGVSYGVPTGGGSSVDNNAIHKNVPGEIVTIPEKTPLDPEDVLILEDSQQNWAKKRTRAGDLASKFLTAPPTGPNSPGIAGQYAYNATGTVRYDCVAADTWRESFLQVPTTI